MSVGVPGAYRHMSITGRYTSEMVAAMLPMAWGHAPWVTREPAVGRCRRGAGKCTHNCELDQWDEGCTVDGSHKICLHRHGGHDQCGKCVCVDPASRRATDTRDPDTHVMAIDLARAFARARFSDVVKEALLLHHHNGLNQTEIAQIQHVSPRAVGLRLLTGHLTIADWLNGDIHD